MSAESLWEPYTPVRQHLPPRPEPPAPPAPPAPPSPPRGRRFRRVIAVVGIALVVLLVGGAGVMYVATEHLGDNVTRVPNAFGGIDEGARPPTSDALTFLLVGTDSGAEPAAARSAVVNADTGADVVMVAHIPPDRNSATVVSIPRDSWLDIPDHGSGRMNSAYRLGGPSLLIRTVEQLSGLRIDHFAIVDFAGFRSVVDAVGGVDVDVRTPVPGFRPGVTHMDGARALAYLRDRTGVENGDRARRQNSTMRAILDKAVSSETLTDPVRLFDFLDAVTQSTGVDDTLSNGGLRTVALKLSNLSSSNVLFVRAPVASVDTGGPNLVVQLDAARAGELWGSVKQGTTGSYVVQNGSDAVGSVTQ